MARVLIIDDAAARNGLRRLFESEGHQVEESAACSQALKRFGEALADALGDA